MMAVGCHIDYMFGLFGCKAGFWACASRCVEIFGFQRTRLRCWVFRALVLDSCVGHTGLCQVLFVPGHAASFMHAKS